MEISYFDETDFKNTIINESIKNEKPDYINLIRNFTAKKSEDTNIKIIIKYAGTLTNAIDIYEKYYCYIIDIDESTINYSDMAFVILYEYFFYDILATILESSLECEK
jgi:hypothetical protein